MSRFVKGLSIGLLALSLAVPALADSKKDGESKENPHLEGQGRLDIAEFLKSLMNSGIMKHGIYENSFVTTTEVEDGLKHKAYDLEIESGYQFYEGAQGSEDGNMVEVPFEMKIRGDVGQDDAKEVIRSGRVGLFRLIYGALTYDIFGINYKQLEAGQGKMIGVELGSVTVNEAISLSSANKIDLILKGKVTVSSMGYAPTEGTQAYMRTFLDPNLLAEHGLPPHFLADADMNSLSVPVSGSVGIRFSDRAIVEVYGSREVGRSLDAYQTANAEYASIQGHARMEHLNLGASVRVKVKGGLYVRGGVEQNIYNSNSSFHEDGIGSYRFVDKKTTRSATIGLGYRW